MTDAEIIKALECCVSGRNSCNNCLMHTMNCTPRVPMAFALDLINCQKAEIERLKEKNESLEVLVLSYGDCVTKTRAEAIREFAERLTDNASLSAVNSFQFAWLITQDEIDNLVKEMTEDSNE